MRIVVGLLLLMVSLSCSSSFVNKIDEMALLCGEGYVTGKDYILISDPKQSAQLNLVTVPKDSTVLTQKGCLERPSGGEVFVTNPDRSSGSWISAQSKDRVVLEPLAASRLPSACNSVVHGDGRGFTLGFDVDSGSKNKSMQTVAVHLRSVTSDEVIASWDARGLEKTLAFEFNAAKPVLSGEYKLMADIKDDLSGAVSQSECLLRLDYSELLVSPAEKINTRRKYNGVEVLVVLPGYSVNFYVHEGFRDVSIEYCLKKVSLAEIREVLGEEILKCDSTAEFLKSKSESFQDGFWVLNFRGKRGLVQNAWQHNVFLVDKVCTGDVESVESLNGKFCTVIRGNMYLNDLDNFNKSNLDTIGEVFGDIKISNSEENPQRVFPNLSQLYGDISISRNDFQSFDGFNALRFVQGSINIEGNDNLTTIKTIESLERISGDLSIGPCRSLTEIRPFKSLLTVQKQIVLTELPLEDLGMFPVLTTLTHLALFDLNIVDLKGLETLTDYKSLTFSRNPQFVNFYGIGTGPNSLDQIRLGEMPLFDSFDGLASHEVKKLDLYDLPELKNLFSRDLKISVLEDLVINKTNLESLVDFELPSKLWTLSISSSPIKNYLSLRSIEDIAWLSLADVPIESFDFLSALRQVSYLEVSKTRLVDFTRSSGVEISVSSITATENSSLKSLNGLRHSRILSTSIKQNPAMNNFEFLKYVDSLRDLKVESSHCLEKSVVDHLNGVSEENVSGFGWMESISQPSNCEPRRTL